MEKRYGTEQSTAIPLYDTYPGRLSAVQRRDQVGAISVTYYTVRTTYRFWSATRVRRVEHYLRFVGLFLITGMIGVLYDRRSVKSVRGLWNDDNAQIPVFFNVVNGCGASMNEDMAISIM